MSVWWIAAICSLLVAGVGAYVQGRIDGSAKYAALLRQAVEQGKLQAQRYDEAREELRTAQRALAAKALQVDKEMGRVLEKPYYAGRECLDSDGVRIFNGTLAAGAGGTAGTVCKADPSDGWACGDGTP